MEQRTNRIGGIIAGVLTQALEDAGARAIVLVMDGTPEAALAERLLQPRLSDRLLTVRAPGAAPADVLAAWANAAAREPTNLVALATSKTAALLGGALPAPLLPLGDLWASQVAELCGGWSAPKPVQELARSAGGIAALDAALAAMVDRRRHPDEAIAALPADAAGTLLALWERTRFARRRLGLVPKLGARTIGVDLFD